MSVLPAIYIAEDVRAALDSTAGLDYNNDLSKIFNGLLTNLGAFDGLLDKIQNNINRDTRIKLLKSFNHKTLKVKGVKFDRYFFDQSIGDLIHGLIGILSYAP